MLLGFYSNMHACVWVWLLISSLGNVTCHYPSLYSNRHANRTRRAKSMCCCCGRTVSFFFFFFSLPPPPYTVNQQDSQQLATHPFKPDQRPVGVSSGENRRANRTRSQETLCWLLLNSRCTGLKI